MANLLSLSNGNSIPALALGTWLSNANDVFEAVRYSITEAGYRHIDGAYFYQNEEAVGMAIKYAIENAKIVRREHLFITSKCWNTFHSRAKVLKCCKESLHKLGLEYLDLYLIHSPMGFAEDGDIFPKDENGNLVFTQIDYVDTWKGMEDCVEAG